MTDYEAAEKALPAGPALVTRIYEPDLPKHDHAFFDPEGESPDIRVWNEASMRAYGRAAMAIERESCARVCSMSSVTMATRDMAQAGLGTWIATETELPDDEKLVLVFVAGGYDLAYVGWSNGIYSHGGRVWYAGSQTLRIGDVPYWMRLPDEPNYVIGDSPTKSAQLQGETA